MRGCGLGKAGVKEAAARPTERRTSVKWRGLVHAVPLVIRASAPQQRSRSGALAASSGEASAASLAAPASRHTQYRARARCGAVATVVLTSTHAPQRRSTRRPAPPAPWPAVAVHGPRSGRVCAGCWLLYAVTSVRRTFVEVVQAYFVALQMSCHDTDQSTTVLISSPLADRHRSGALLPPAPQALCCHHLPGASTSTCAPTCVVRTRAAPSCSAALRAVW